MGCHMAGCGRPWEVFVRPMKATWALVMSLVVPDDETHKMPLRVHDGTFSVL